MANIFWLMGISGSGKTTIGNKLVEYLKINTKNAVELLDGDIVRDFFGKDLGYSIEERNFATKRIAFCAHLLAKNNINTVVTNISGSKEIQDFIQEKLKDNLCLIYLECSLKEVIKRDPKGLYRNYQLGKEKNLIGADIAFHTPYTPDLLIKTEENDEEKSWILLKEFIDIKITGN
jgi:adenylylsulfate kinase